MTGQTLQNARVRKGPKRRSKTRHGRAVFAPRSPNLRSKISNDFVRLAAIDGRSAVARRVVDIASQICVDQGGIDRVSEVKLQMIRAYAGLCVLREDLEKTRFVDSQDIDTQEYVLICSGQVRLGQRIGVTIVAKDVTPTLAELIEQASTPRADDAEIVEPVKEAAE